MDKLSPSLIYGQVNLCNNYLYFCGQVMSLMMSVLSQKICVLIVLVCRNGSNVRWIELTCQ
jgi:hypothetical protein